VVDMTNYFNISCDKFSVSRSDYNFMFSFSEPISYKCV